MKVVLPKLQLFKSDTLFGYTTDLLELLNRNTTTTLAPHIATIADMHRKLEEGYRLDQKNAYTAAIQTANKRRSDAIAGIKKMLESYAYHFKEDVRKTSNLLLNDLKKYGTFSKMTYQAETGALTKIIEDWYGNSTFNNAIEFLNLSEWREELKAAQEEFTKLYMDRIDSEASKTATPIYKLKPEAIKVFQNFAMILSTFVQISPDFHVGIAAKVNELSKKYDESLHSSKNETSTSI